MEIIFIAAIVINFAIAVYFLKKNPKCPIEDYYIKSGYTLNVYKFKNTVKFYK